jgi:predicted RNA methylase
LDFEEPAANTMKLKHLESALSSVKYRFDNPRVELEQYPTSPHLAASVCLAAFERGDLGPECAVADLGCGTGMLTLASALLDCYQLIAIDLDEEALSQARDNAEEMEMEHIIDFVRAELKFTPSTTSSSAPQSRHNKGGRGGRSGRHKGRYATASHGPATSEQNPAPQGELIITPETANDGIPLKSKCVDTVLINPPFGTKNNAGIDVGFLAAGCRLARHSVYSFHKTSTRPHLEKKAKQWGMGFEVVAEMQFDIPASYKFHKQKCVQIEVDLIRLFHLNGKVVKQG